MKPHVVYLGADPALSERIQATLSHTFQVTCIADPTDLQTVMDKLRQLRPDYVILDPHLTALTPHQLHQRLKTDPELARTQILVINP